MITAILIFIPGFVVGYMAALFWLAGRPMSRRKYIRLRNMEANDKS